jgi:signal transduction histidine kinase
MFRRFAARASLKQKIAAAVSCCFVLTMWGSAAIVNAHVVEEYRAAKAQEELRILAALAASIESKVRSAKELVEAVTREISPEIVADPDRAQAFLDQRGALQTLFSSGLFLDTPDGALIAEYPFVPGRRGVHVPFFDEAAAKIRDTHSPYVLGPFPTVRKNNRPAIDIGMNVFDASGAWIAHFDGATLIDTPNWLDEIGRTVVGKTGYVALVNEQGEVVAGPEALPVFKRIAPKDADPFLEKALRGFEGFLESADDGPDARFVAVRRVPEINGVLIASQLQSEALQPLSDARWMALLVLVVGTGVAVGLSWLIVNRWLAPLNRLAGEVAGLGPSTALPATAAGDGIEIAHLRAAFARLLADLAARQEQLRQSQKMEAVGQLTGGVAHDFNNLLGVISGNLELLEEALPGQPDLQRMLQAAVRAADRGATLTRSLMAFARQQPLEPRALDVNELTREMTELLRRTVPESIDIQVVPASGWICEADPGQLQNALLNLVANARDAMPRGGRLTIETGDAKLDAAYAAANAEVTPGDYVVLAVSDTGKGMSPDIVARAFEPFFTTKGAGQGTGLGLSMVYGFAKQSRGHAKIYSEVGQGTTVRVYLPRTASGVEAPAAAAGTTKAHGRGETILVVEDDADMRTLAVSVLRSLGYQALEAAGAQDALRLLREGRPLSLLLTDVVLPGSMNGRDLAQEAERLYPGLKVIYMSGYTENAVLHHGRLDPGVQLLQKPFRLRDLAERVRAVLDPDGSA